VADSDETEKVSYSVDAEKVIPDATKNAGTAAVKAKEEFENVKGMRAHEVRTW
jgi:hypothetical protein